MEKLYRRDTWEGFRARTTNSEVQGWYGDHPALSRLLSLSSDRRRVIAIDIGVWKGQSTINLATTMKREGIDGCVISIDTFLGSHEHWGPGARKLLGSDENWETGAELFDRLNGLPDLYRTFLDNVWHAGVFEYVVPLPQTSRIAAQILLDAGVKASVIHIDASHEYEEVLQDADTYWALLLPRGYLIGDDYSKAWPGVVRAADEFSSRVGCPLAIEEPKWILQKPPQSGLSTEVASVISAEPRNRAAAEGQ